MVGCRCEHRWDEQFADLLAVADHGTTDGKPYVEPPPEIGDGYRVATEAEAWRLDVEFCSCVGWHKRGNRAGKSFVPNYNYRVPVDRIPTDEDAVGRPAVMVQNRVSGEWYRASLLAVTDDATYPFCVLMGGEVDGWMNCRFPYPGELD
jgi:hypothetical protein